jgi:hypothetical protein
MSTWHQRRSRGYWEVGLDESPHLVTLRDRVQVQQVA